MGFSGGLSVYLSFIFLYYTSNIEGCRLGFRGGMSHFNFLIFVYYTGVKGGVSCRILKRRVIFLFFYCLFTIPVIERGFVSDSQEACEFYSI